MVNQPSSNEKKASIQDREALSIRENEKKVDVRLRDVIDEESLASFGRRCGISEGGIRKYLNGASPSTEKLVAIADTANVNIEWLATGRGPKMRGASSIPTIPPAPQLQPSLINIDDLERLTMAIETVEEALEAMRRDATPTLRAKLYTAAYDLLLDMEPRENIIKFLKLAS